MDKSLEVVIAHPHSVSVYYELVYSNSQMSASTYVLYSVSGYRPNCACAQLTY